MVSYIFNAKNLCVCSHTHTHTSTRVHMHILYLCIYICVCIQTSKETSACVYVCLYVWLYISIYRYVCLYDVFICACTHPHSRLQCRLPQVLGEDADGRSRGLIFDGSSSARTGSFPNSLVARHDAQGRWPREAFPMVALAGLGMALRRWLWDQRALTKVPQPLSWTKQLWGHWKWDFY